MEYVDFDLALESVGDTSCRVAVLRSPAGEVSATADLPTSLSALSTQVRTLVQAAGSGRARDLIVLAPAEVGVHAALARPPGRSLEDCGRELFETLMPTEVLACFRVSLERARAEGKGLRVRLRLDEPALASVPWEYAYDPSLRDHVCLSTETSIVRYLDLDRPPPVLKVQPPLRILGLIASPSDLPRLDVDRERLQLERSLEHLTDKGAISIEWLAGATWRDLQQAMRRGPWHVFHYIGHSGIETTSGDSVIALCDDDGKTFRLDAVDLGRLLSGHGAMRLAVLNSCESGRTAAADVYSSAGAILIRRGIAAVVSMQFVITDRAALEFSRTFYEALVDGAAVDRAVTDARRSISIALGGTYEWGTPVLYTRATDGALFDLDVVSAVFPDRRPPTPARGAAATAAAPTAAASAPVPGGKASEGRAVLARKVSKFWIEGVLEHSLFRAAQIDLGMDRVSGAVANPYTNVLDQAAGTSSPLGAGRTIRDVFDDEGGSLLILGEPGSGKTTSMLGLLRGLLQRVKDEPAQAVPVVFNLSSWRSGQALDVWLVDELSAKYQLPRKIGRGWIEASAVLPLLDGLDEVAGDIRAACVTSINDFAHGGACVGTVVCCRVKEYIALPNRLALNTAIQLRDLTRDQVVDWVSAAGAPLSALHHMLQRDSDLLTMARSPLMLSLMARTYRDVTIETLAQEDRGSAEDRRTALMDAYVNRMFRRASGTDDV